VRCPHIQPRSTRCPQPDRHRRLARRLSCTLTDVNVPEALADRAAADLAGSVWLAHLDCDEQVVLVVKVQEPIRPALDELFLRHVVDVIRRLALPGVVVAVTRPDGKVQRVDRRFRRELCSRLAETETELVALFVVGESASRAVTTARPKPVDGRQRHHPAGPRRTERPSAHGQQQNAQADRGTDR
jgi:hypothetical protein